jgi:hypothetical protein
MMLTSTLFHFQKGWTVCLWETLVNHTILWPLSVEALTQLYELNIYPLSPHPHTFLEDKTEVAGVHTAAVLVPKPC